MPTRFCCKAQTFLLCLVAMFAICICRAQTIGSFAPASGAVGTLVTITGTGLNNPTIFTIGGVTALVISNNGTTLVGMVMPGAASGKLSITTTGGSAISNNNFTVTATSFPSVQQGNKLVGAGAVGNASQGGAVAISADGNTAIVGGLFDNKEVGAAWIFARKGNTWVQQGGKLLGNDTVGTHTTFGNIVAQGSSVAISADGNTVVVGGDWDNNGAGAAWIFIRTGCGTWVQ